MQTIIAILNNVFPLVDCGEAGSQQITGQPTGYISRQSAARANKIKRIAFVCC